MVSLFLLFGERESNDVIDFVGLDGRDANALGNEGGNVFLWITLIRFAFEVR